MAQLPLQVGNLVQPIAHVDAPQRTDYEGKFIRLSPVNPQTDVTELYKCSHGSDIKMWLYQNPDQQLSLTALNSGKS